MEDNKGTVCVTGGTGYVASWLIMRLLQHGYLVRATVRSHHAAERKKDLSYLTNLPEASKRLQIFHADLDQPGSFNSAIEGCVGVFHLAHPMDVQGQEPEETVTKRAVEGTLGILKACLESKTVKRVVYTSSATTVLFNGNGLDMLDEDTWSDLEICRSSNIVSSSYLVSKILTEKAALEFGKENGLEVVSLILPLVVGPFICPKIPSSVYIALAMIFGDENQCQYLVNSYMVHIDDATRALIFLLDYDDANGRYICSSDQISFDEMHALLCQRYPEYHITIPNNIRETTNTDRKFSGLSSRKLLNTGFQFEYGINEMYDGAMKCCKEKGFL
ncbi:protein BRI1-5 ENHANCED 1 [Gastrolobium bilobum]|uniref:protein BRI1-5 ENHANCED 1 n=1 Tax=Gastrolobium bilobum TaxID=150636 RepID=UPI002AAF8728|nr:protein BRI1-5 ENHANCED 1 [Gastrolobium bilobum]